MLTRKIRNRLIANQHKLRCLEIKRTELSRSRLQKIIRVRVCMKKELRGSTLTRATSLLSSRATPPLALKAFSSRTKANRLFLA